MKEKKLEELLARLEASPPGDLYQPEGEMLLKILEIPGEERPDWATVFQVLSNWLGNSLRSGVWTYYEIADPAELETTREYLEGAGQPELLEQFARGIHDYRGCPDFQYPEEWEEEADGIDRWIFEQEEFLNLWLRDLLLANREPLRALLTRGEGERP